MLTKHEQKVLKVLAVYNDCTEEQARENILKAYLAHFAQSAATIFPEWTTEHAGPEININAEDLKGTASIDKMDDAETIVQNEEPKRRGRRPRKPLDKMVEEIHAADKMTKDEFVDYFSGGAR